MSNDVLTLKRYEEREKFLEAVRGGTPKLLAAHEVGWTPRQMKAHLADRDFAELVDWAVECRDDNVEKKLYEKANDGNMTAIVFILLNRRPSQFKDTKRIEVHHDGSVQADVVHSVRDGLLGAIKAGVEIAALQQGGVIDVDSIED